VSSGKEGLAVARAEVRHGSEDYRPVRESSNKPEPGFGSWRLRARAVAGSKTAQLAVDVQPL
jgi:hypothetical protein